MFCEGINTNFAEIATVTDSVDYWQPVAKESRQFSDASICDLTAYII